MILPVCNMVCWRGVQDFKEKVNGWLLDASMHHYVVLRASSIWVTVDDSLTLPPRMMF